MFGTRYGQASVTVGELIANQARLLQRLGVNVRSRNLGTPGSPIEPGAEPALWERPGTSPTLQRLVLDLHGGGASVPRARICIEAEFVFERTGGAIGPSRMRLAHRAAGGGLVKLTRYVCTKADSSDGGYGRVESRAGPDLSMLPLDFCVAGTTAQHARTAQFLVLHLVAHERMAAEATALFAEVYKPCVDALPRSQG